MAIDPVIHLCGVLLSGRSLKCLMTAYVSFDSSGYCTLPYHKVDKI